MSDAASRVRFLKKVSPLMFLQVSVLSRRNVVRSDIYMCMSCWS